ncbi:hypothetical protein [Neorhizobium galegae]|uniref:hypothetical protein n=1 Tax=Neorhizobium galegae TaxID=399 RepID=UPI000621FF9F|nr:hypothetical protein [Neorhizobium galegae]CDZ27685.1 Hypothetical protein NGAL_HAMBI490_25320 [Neorhizobium galegae bv. officinalis]KAA9386679.1 hypothetical protein F4V88_09440 [Neorhizobium galegae]KAB1109067.1 hypothetical protein F4V89_28185 [Neorhizobium galegae]MCM2501479.1 hypothetical protein [Neorhizobium galegae]MCQ1772430.1 hypothetical protein [Neorhizobium galegae]
MIGSGGLASGDVAFGRGSVQGQRRRNSRYVTQARWGVAIAILLCTAIQLAISLELANMFGAVSAGLTGILVFSYCTKPSRIERHTISTLVVLGFQIHSSLAALMVQTFAWKPITFNLEAPVATFSVLALLQIWAVALHWFYAQSRLMQAATGTIRQRIFAPLGLYRSPTNRQLWWMGLLGSFASWYVHADRWGEDNFGDIAFKLLAGLSQFSVAPFLIPIAGYLIDPPGGKRSVNWLALSAYCALTLYIALARNSRGVFAVNVLTVLICLALAVVIGRFILTRRRGIWLAVTVVISPIPAGILSDLATAMVIARDDRSDLSSQDLVLSTIDTYFDREALQSRQEMDRILAEGSYNEIYIDNPLLARFVATKYIDHNIALGLSLSQTGEGLARENAVNQLLLLLPTPVLNFFAPELEKSGNAFSSGDYYNFLVTGDELGGYRTGSSIADGFVVLGSFYLVVFAIFALATFIVGDALAIRMRDGHVLLSALACICIVRFFMNGLMDESVAVQVGNLVRALPQTVLLYVLMFWLTRGVKLR